MTAKLCLVFDSHGWAVRLLNWSESARAFRRGINHQFEVFCCAQILLHVLRHGHFTNDGFALSNVRLINSLYIDLVN